MEAEIHLGDPARLQTLVPHLLLARTLGSGHLSPLEVPGQVNSMIARFLLLHLPS